ncbi:hypothetical protein AJ79_08142 [Helicocarpus griseus UAMH5409]|uniref:Malate dehydrogenase n=1 Tax=Helicocarpus griseus UAMH5409 TaxID=1447875 RepID=A0A2B7WVQ1_9EURO|nr:hypothetical protein AJ79_08142 [Helicocarpus griseus UAMH5409]
MQFLLLLASMASMALAAPPGWSADTAKFYSGVSKEIRNARNSNRQQPQCDFTRAVLPSTDKPLPQVPEGQKLLHVAIGRGTQNYTCTSPNSKERLTKPKATGALATLYSATCLAATYPYLLSLLPNIALQLTNPPYSPIRNPSSDPSTTFGPNAMPVIGYHYFSGEGVPIFDLLADGHAAVEKIEGVDAPKGAMAGVGEHVHGAVPWLFLAGVEGNEGKAKSVYRVNTAGGTAPGSCEEVEDGKEAVVEYAAEYWFFG